MARSRQPERAATPASPIERHLTERSGYYVAEAWGVVVAKLVTLALAGLGVSALVWLARDGGWGWLVAAPFILAAVALALWVALVPFNGLVLERLRPEVRFRRLRGAPRRRRARAADEPAAVDVADPPDLADPDAPVLRSSPRGQADLISRAALYLVLGLPVVFLVGYVLLAYLEQLWLRWSSPSVDTWAWDYPEWSGAFGDWFFTEVEGPVLRVVVPTLSAVLLVAGIVLAMQAVPVLLRRGADAIDLAVTESGVVTRGGLGIGWDEVADVLVVEDVQITSWKSRRERTGFHQPPFVLHPTYVPGHSRTRVALVLHDLPVVAARATRSQRRGLHADGDFASGYALADLWTHPTDRVEATLTALEAGARAARVPVRHLERVADPSRHWR
ncbi:hypothetical protein [Isoptericola sp. NPDC057391]|uniref:hypothetical protein n=1 Tax=Isoptericola sp. NPDC057391 TaxID=3346117 RepID=UPI00364269A6